MPSVKEDAAILYFKRYSGTGETVSYLKTLANGDGERMTEDEATRLCGGSLYVSRNRSAMVFCREEAVRKALGTAIAARGGLRGFFKKESRRAVPDSGASRESIIEYCHNLLLAMSEAVDAPPADGGRSVWKDVVVLVWYFDSTYAITWEGAKKTSVQEVERTHGKAYFTHTGVVAIFCKGEWPRLRGLLRREGLGWLDLQTPEGAGLQPYEAYGESVQNALHWKLRFGGTRLSADSAATVVDLFKRERRLHPGEPEEAVLATVLRGLVGRDLDDL